MSIRTYKNQRPVISDSVYVDESAVVIGDVILSARSSVWPCAVIRGDVNSIFIGTQSNIQDGAVVHVTHDGPFTPGGFSTHVGENVTVGHQAIIHACTIKGSSLIGMGAKILDGAIVEEHVILAAGSVVAPGKVLESGSLYMGVPARKVRPLRQKEIDHIQYSARYYHELAQTHQSQS